MKHLWVIGGLALIVVLTLSVFGLPVGPSLARIFEGGLGSEAGIGRTFAKATPLILTALGTVVAWRAGLFNIGGEGQYIMGGLLGAACFRFLPMSPAPVLILMAAVGGGLYALLAGWLQVRRGVPVVISTILLNFLAVQVLALLVTGPLKAAKGGLPQTDYLPAGQMLPRLNPRTDLHTGALIAILAAFIIWALLYHFRQGFEIRLVGAGPGAARANGLPVERLQLRAMALSGALAGLAGGIEYTAMTGAIDAGFPQQWGFLGIPVALLGGLHPLGVLASGLGFGVLFAGSQQMARFGQGGDTIIYVIQAVAMLAVVAGNAIQQRRRAVAA